MTTITLRQAAEQALANITRIPTLDHGVLVKLSDVDTALRAALQQPEPQAQAEPKVVAWLNAKWNMAATASEIARQLDGEAVESSPAFVAGELHALITLQAHREAMAGMSATEACAAIPAVMAYCKQQEESIAAKDAALKACVEALEMTKTGLQWYRDQYPEAVDGSDDEANAEIDAAITQAEGALK